MNHNLYVALTSAVPKDLDRVAITTANIEPLRYTWRDLARGTAMLANLLAFLDLPPGSRIAMHTEKSVEALMLYLAVLRAGHVILPLNPAYQASEVEYFIRDAEPAVVVCSASNFGWISKIAFRAGTAHVFTLNANASGSLIERAAAHSDQHVPAQRGQNDLAAIIYTSGTTGRSKGAMLSHGNLLSNALTLKHYWCWRHDDVLVHALPIFHVHGLFVASHAALLGGSSMIWINKFDPHLVVDYLPMASVFMGVPTMYSRLLSEPGLNRKVCESMRLFIAGSAPLLLDTFNEWRERTGHTVLERYGMSETLILTSNPCDPQVGPRRGGTVGLPLPGTQLRVMTETGSSCAPDEIGGIEVRGPSVFQGYWRMPEKTREDFTADGWFKTGDLGLIHEDGYVSIAGRSKDLIISGGFNVYPAEIEDFINELPNVAESAVIGVPHSDFGEAVVAIVVPKAGAALDNSSVVEHLRKQIANFKVPKQVLVVNELPRNAMGKVQKNLLREEHKGLFSQ